MHLKTSLKNKFPSTITLRLFRAFWLVGIFGAANQIALRQFLIPLFFIGSDPGCQTTVYSEQLYHPVVLKQTKSKLA